jgi:hypothetical protein
VGGQEGAKSGEIGFSICLWGKTMRKTNLTM